MSTQSEAEFLQLIRHNVTVNEILTRLPELNTPDTWLVSGCLFQTAWNVLTGEPPGRGIKDYDVFYFDAADLSERAESAISQRAAALFADLDCPIDIRNQARVHIWYEKEFGVKAYPRLTKSTDGVDNFLAVCCMVAARNSSSGNIELYAPLGVDDILNRIVRQNPWYPNAPKEFYDRKAERWRKLWPNLRVEPCGVS